MGVTEDGDLNAVFLDLFLHILKVHAPYAVLVLFQIGGNDVHLVVFENAGKAYIGGSMNQNGVARFGQGVQNAGNAAKNAVFVADVGFGQTVYAETLSLPVDDGIIVTVGIHVVTEQRMLQTLSHSFHNRRSSRYVHIGDPHGQIAEVGALCPSGHGVDVPFQRVVTGALPYLVKIVFSHCTDTTFRKIEGSCMMRRFPFIIALSTRM